MKLILVTNEFIQHNIPQEFEKNFYTYNYEWLFECYKNKKFNFQWNFQTQRKCTINLNEEKMKKIKKEKQQKNKKLKEENKEKPKYLNQKMIKKNIERNWLIINKKRNLSQISNKEEGEPKTKKLKKNPSVIV